MQKKEVLFLCVHNAGRSQMAAALLNYHAMGRVAVKSAGSQPANQLNPTVVQAMAEIEIDVSSEFPKPLTNDLAYEADIIVTMGCGDTCPAIPGKRFLDWVVQDPTGLPLSEVRTIRDRIEIMVLNLLIEIIESSNEHK